MGGIPEDTLRARIVAAFPDAEVHLEDLTGTRDHWRAKIVSRAFDGVSAVMRHRLVYKALADELRGPIHALALETLTPSESD